MTPQTVAEFLTAHPTACSEARTWLLSLGPDATMAQAWTACVRSDWMLWALHVVHHKSYPGPRHFACDCARWDHERRRAAGQTIRPESLACLDAVHGYTVGTHTAQQMAAAWDAARDAAWDAARDAARDAAWAAARAAARDAAWDVAGAWQAAAWDAAAWNAARAWQADRLRHYVPKWPEVSHAA